MDFSYRGLFVLLELSGSMQQLWRTISTKPDCMATVWNLIL